MRWDSPVLILAVSSLWLARAESKDKSHDEEIRLKWSNYFIQGVQKSLAASLLAKCFTHIQHLKIPPCRSEIVALWKLAHHIKQVISLNEETEGGRAPLLNILTVNYDNTDWRGCDDGPNQKWGKLACLAKLNLFTRLFTWVWQHKGPAHMQLALQTTIIALEHTSTFKIFTALTSYARCVEKEKKYTLSLR